MLYLHSMMCRCCRCISSLWVSKAKALVIVPSTQDLYQRNFVTPKPYCFQGWVIDLVAPLKESECSWSQMTGTNCARVLHYTCWKTGEWQRVEIITTAFTGKISGLEHELCNPKQKVKGYTNMLKYSRYSVLTRELDRQLKRCLL